MLDRTLGDEELPRGDVQQRQAPLSSLGKVEGCEVVILLVVQDVVPRVTSSVIPRLTGFFVSLGSSSWSQMATRLPALTSLGR